jgi:hypothetical protein
MFLGSSGLGAFKLPVATSQNLQARLQESPRIIKVSVPASQHAPIFGQEADSQTVFKPYF